jgi:TM2 domain-containing membrane protein YozV/ribosomal protein L40E
VEILRGKSPKMYDISYVEVKMSDGIERQKQADEVFCSSCGAVIKKEAEICPKCGVRPKKAQGTSLDEISESKWLTALLLNLFLGIFGAHRFYVGKIGTGILMLLTLGGLGIWEIIDFIMIITGKFRDKHGRVLSHKAS